MSDRNTNLEITAAFPAVGMHEEAPDVSYKEIFANETAFNMFLNKVQETDVLYSIKVRQIEEKDRTINYLKHKISMLEKKSSERLSAVLITTVAEFITAIGVGILSPSENKLIPALVIFAGLLMARISLWLNFKPTSDKKHSADGESIDERMG